MSTRHNQRGVSLVELILFIVIVSLALAGVLGVLNVTTRNSADPLVYKQALSIAESLLEEVALMPFTYCDPDDANAANATAADAANCPAAGGIGGVENLGPEAGETRYAAPQFDNVNDYHNFTMTAGNISDITGTAIPLLAGYSATVTITAPGLVAIAAANTLLITVTVTGPDNIAITLEGYRTRYAPVTLP